MKQNRFYNLSFILLILIMLKADFIETVLKTCDVTKLKTFGVKILCESKIEDSVPCAGPYINKVYLQCRNGYESEEHIKIKTLHCKDGGEWSQKPLLCSPKCIGYQNKLELLDMITFPTPYIEFKRKNAVDGEKNKFPGIILSERQILTTNFNYVDDYHLIIYRSKGRSKILYNVDLINRSNIKNGNLILGLPFYNNFYIKYDADTKPACKNISNILEIPELSKDGLDLLADKYTVQPHYCYVPKVSNIKVQVNCMGYTDGILSTKCLSQVYEVEIRCQIGYKNYNLNPKTDILTKCRRGKWEVFGEEDDCQLICGQIAEHLHPYLSKLLYKGNSANIVNAPWHVAVYANNTGTYSTFEQVCGGSIIHSNVVISTAHCFYDDGYSKLHSPNNFLIGAGKTYRSIGASDEFASYMEIKYIHIPLQYQSAPVRNDIAVLILKNHLQYNRRIKPVCINLDSRDNYHTTIGFQRGWVVGWGARSTKDISSSKLLKLNFQTLSNYECKKLVHPKYKSEITGDKFCAQNAEGGTACQGDSGGGFFIEKYVGYQRRYFLVGIVSVGINREKYCSDGSITMFTNVKLYSDFIQQAISINYMRLPKLENIFG